MKIYFSLQYNRVKRFLNESGVNHYLAFGIAILVFITVSHFIFEKVMYANYVYPILGLSALNMLGNRQRNEFLKNCFSIHNYRKIRLFENLISAAPFSIYLLYKQEFLIAGLMLLTSAIFSLFNKMNRFQFVIPTPFYKNPFEFLIGFRKTYLLFIISYILTGISISVGNFNLGIFALLVVFLTCLNFYAKPEPLNYVWIHAQSPKEFIKKKIKLASFHGFMLSMPIVLALAIFNPDKAHLLIIFDLLGMLYVTVSLLGKYAFYPAEINLSQGILIGLSVIFPPLTLIIIPFLYKRATKNLAQFLYD